MPDQPPNNSAIEDADTRGDATMRCPIDGLQPSREVSRPRFLKYYAAFVGAILAMVYVLCTLVLLVISMTDSSADDGAVRLIGWRITPYNNAFIRAGCWTAAIGILFILLPDLMRWLERRIPSKPLQIAAKGLSVFGVVFAAEMVWLVFVRFMGGESDVSPGTASMHGAFIGTSVALSPFLKAAEKHADDDVPAAAVNSVFLGITALLVVLGAIGVAVAIIFGPTAAIVVVPPLLFIPLFFAKVPRRGDPGV